MRPEQVSRNYDAVASRYDLLTDVVFKRLLRLERHREHTIDLLGPLGGRSVLDIGCGTGRSFPLLRERVGAEGRIVGFDYSSGMLDQAQRLIDEHGWSNVQLVRGDAAKLEGVPSPFDAVVSVWCMGIVDDLDGALKRSVEVLSAGGRLAIMDFGRARPDRGALRWLYPVYRFALLRAGIDAAEDLDDDRLRARWERGRVILRDRLGDWREERYLRGTGLILSGEKEVPKRAAPR